MNERETLRQAWKERALVEHARLSKFFESDRIVFERERKKIITESIAECDDSRRKQKLEMLQEKIDNMMRGAKSPHNRLVLMKMLFWSQVHNAFIPALRIGEQIKPCWDIESKKTQKTMLTLCEKK